MSFSCLIAVVRTSSAMLNASGKSWHPHPVEKFGTFHHWVWCWLWVSHIHVYGLYYVEVCSLYIYFVESLYHKLILSFGRSVFCIHWDNHMIFILQFVNVFYHSDWLCMLKHSCIPWMNPIWQWYMIYHFSCYWIVF